MGKLRKDLLHVPYRSLQEQRKTIQVYTSIAARELADRGCSFAPLRMLFNPGWRVFRSLVLKAGFLAGWRGFMLAGMEARYAYLKYRKLMQLRKEACPDLSTGEKVAVGDHPLPALPPSALLPEMSVAFHELQRSEHTDSSDHQALARTQFVTLEQEA